MKCAVHQDADATGYCRNCGKAMCPQCTREVRGALYCETCLGNLVMAPASPAPAATAGPNPGVAALLGFIPGLGAVYNGEYVKALIQVVVFGGMIAALSSDSLSEGYEAFFGIALGCFCLYMPIDSYRVAKARRLGLPEPSSLPTTASGRPVGAIVLIALGVLFLLSNFGLFDVYWIRRMWPLGLIAIGVWLVVDRAKQVS
jgi:hypothetical protein